MIQKVELELMPKSKIIFSCAMVLIAIVGFAGGAAIARTINERSEEDKKEKVLGQQSDEPVDTFDLTVGEELENDQPMDDTQQNTATPQDGDEQAQYNTSIPGLKYRILTEGEGKEVQTGSNVLMHYEGTLTSDGSKFDSSYDRGQPFQTTIGVGMLIQGWDQGVPGMKEGEKRELVISPELGYGERGAGASIPPNAELKFIVEVVEVLD